MFNITTHCKNLNPGNYLWSPVRCTSIRRTSHATLCLPISLLSAHIPWSRPSEKFSILTKRGFFVHLGNALIPPTSPYLSWIALRWSRPGPAVTHRGYEWGEGSGGGGCASNMLPFGRPKEPPARPPGEAYSCAAWRGGSPSQNLPRCAGHLSPPLISHCLRHGMPTSRDRVLITNTKTKPTPWNPAASARPSTVGWLDGA